MTTEKLYSFEGKDDKPLKLYYFDIPGKAEPIRCALYHSKIPFVDVRSVKQLQFEFFYGLLC